MTKQAPADISIFGLETTHLLEGIILCSGTLTCCSVVSLNYCSQVYACRNCMLSFTSSEAFTNHQEICHDYCKVKMPNNTSCITTALPSRKTESAETAFGLAKLADDILKFEKHHFKSRLPVVIYADFEAINIQLQTASPSNKQSYNNRISKKEAISYGIYIKSDYTNLFFFSIHYLYWL